VVLQFWEFGEGRKTPHSKTSLLCYTGSGKWWTLVNTVMNLRVPQKIRKIVLKCVLLQVCEGENWIELAQDRVQWWAFLNI
jgi:hypothetical protein